MKRYAGGVAAAVVLALVISVFHAMGAFELPGSARVSDHGFTAAGHRLSGTLALPDTADTPAVVLIVHGDGPQDRWSDSAYLPMVNSLLAAGIGVFSWDKPGGGQSGGDWLSQSMADRAEEAAAALRYLRDDLGHPHDRLGFLGFSQAGWVVPRASAETDAAYAVLIGPAITWREQGAYYTARRLERAGMSAADVEAAVAENLAENDRMFGGDGDCAAREDLSPARCGFVRRNYGADATVEIAAMETPALVLVGAEDLNVDPVETAEVYRRNARHEVRIVPAATHSLLRARHYNFQIAEDWPLWTRARFVLSGPRAYAPGVLEEIAQWIKAHAG